ncbi:hypothetical protein A3Q56_00736 [Intoshia linei]|uniref:Myotubularin phosphatase domain-containing protein n=1 Tax=Intoshia linei TaxID=1819745 RepID=A0A177BD98_9BILA|nr:hypothetical protein A3Q56_00736 [Intoshia linei]
MLHLNQNLILNAILTLKIVPTSSIIITINVQRLDIIELKNVEFISITLNEDHFIIKNRQYDRNNLEIETEHQMEYHEYPVPYSILKSFKQSETNKKICYIKCHNFFNIIVEFYTMGDVIFIQETFESIKTIKKIDQLVNYCLYQHNKMNLSDLYIGWEEDSFYSLKSQYKRMNLPEHLWKISHLNSDFTLSETYPKYIIVPARVLDTTVRRCAEFRCKGRLPILTYIFRTKDQYIPICRSSQPKSGFDKRSLGDELFIKQILKTTDSNIINVVDLRPLKNIYFNMAAGKGYEKEKNYKNIKFSYQNMQNIHVIRNSLKQMMKASKKVVNQSEFNYNISNSFWLKHILTIIDASKCMAKYVCIQNNPVLSHCSDGWDRTAQTCSLTQMMLSPHYRTIDGLIELIEKDWIHFGHKFRDRCDFLNTKNDEKSPVFLQFIECCWQILSNFPSEFQYNESFLIRILDEMFMCRFGTFLSNCIKERKEYFSKKTCMLWPVLLKDKDKYINKYYLHKIDILPLDSPYQIRYWDTFYNRSEPKKNIEWIRDSLTLNVKKSTIKKIHDILSNSQEYISKRFIGPKILEQDEDIFVDNTSDVVCF